MPRSDSRAMNVHTPPCTVRSARWSAGGRPVAEGGKRQPKRDSGNRPALAYIDVTETRSGAGQAMGQASGGEEGEVGHTAVAEREGQSGDCGEQLCVFEKMALRGATEAAPDRYAVASRRQPSPAAGKGEPGEPGHPFCLLGAERAAARRKGSGQELRKAGLTGLTASKNTERHGHRTFRVTPCWPTPRATPRCDPAAPDSARQREETH